MIRKSELKYESPCWRESEHEREKREREKKRER